MSLDLSKLNSFSKDVYNKIIARHPEWEKYAKVQTWQAGSNQVVFLSVEIPSPVPGIFPVEITTIEDVDEEITVYFGPADIHMHMYLPHKKHSVTDQLDGVDEITQKIFNEELISVQSKPGFFGWVAEGMVTPEEYQKRLDKGKLRRAVSWKGTFNYPYDGTHADWNPPRKKPAE